MDMTSRDDGGRMAWRLSEDVAGIPAEREARANEQLHSVSGERPDVWEASGEHPRFRLELANDLLAGWYRLEVYLQSVDDSVLMPALYPVYADHADMQSEIGLPDPDDDGCVRALVLLTRAVRMLEVSPGVCPQRFRMHGLCLRRVSRRDALAGMLQDGSTFGRDSWGTVARRGLTFLADASVHGLSRATDRLFHAYQRRLRPVDLNDYDLWVRKFDTLSAPHMAAWMQRAAQCESSGPLISVLVPTYDTAPDLLRRCLDSVREQVYECWQLCVADDASPDSRVMAVLEEYAGLDSRIKVCRRERNGHISAASNTALGMADGEYVALLDHDDELRPHALLEMAEAIVRQPDIGLLYSDEDKLDVDGRRYDPYFKPDWNPDLLCSQNYACHLTVIRASLVREVGGFRKGFEGSQDHDLILRCTERLQAAQIHHVPKILYHWRAIEGSTALSRDSKDYASAAGARAVSEHLQRMDTGARVEELSHGHFRVFWPVPQPVPKVSLIIPTRDRTGLLRTCVETILERSTYGNVELVVVDNQSREPDALAYLEQLRGRDRVRVLGYDAPFNYAALNNWAATQCDGRILGLVNNDIEVITPGWLEEMVGHVLRPDIGAVGAMLYYPDDTIQHAGVVLGVHGVAGHIYAGMPRGYHGHGARAWVAQELSAVTGACMLVRRSVFEEVGGLDERLQVAFNDIDFCLRLRECGYRNLWTPFAELYHHESASRGSDDTEDKRARFAGEVQFMLDRWDAVLQHDPAYNPNLSLTSLNFDLAFPPRA